MTKDFAKTYLLKIKKISIILALFFIASFFLGYFLAYSYPEKTKEIIYQGLKEMIEPAKDYSSFQLFEFIFIKNITAVIISILLGIIFGIVPILIIIINGITLGVVSYIMLEQFNIFVLLAGILPHGIIEIPALIFSAASGVWLWRSFYRYVRYDENIMAKELISVFQFLLFIIMPMLALAALIETFFTPRILDLIMPFRS